MSLHAHLLEFAFSPALSRNSEVIEVRLNDLERSLTENIQCSLRNLVLFFCSSTFKALHKAISVFENTVETQPWKDISIKDACTVASELIGQNLHRINRVEETRLCFEAALLSIFANTSKSIELKMDMDTFLTQVGAVCLIYA